MDFVRFDLARVFVRDEIAVNLTDDCEGNAVAIHLPIRDGYLADLPTTPGRGEIAR